MAILDQPLMTIESGPTSSSNFGLRWPGDSQRESGRFARIDSQKNPHFHNVPAIRANRLKTAILNFQPPRSAIPKKWIHVQESQDDSRESGNSRESGHLRLGPFACLGWPQRSPTCLCWGETKKGSLLKLGTEKVPQRNCVTKILTNIWVNFLGRCASKPLFYWVMTGNPFEFFITLFWCCSCDFLAL